MIKSAYKMLGLMSFLTAGEKEVRAWTIPIGTKAPKAAGTIHTDIERGFIRAEIISYDDLMACGSRKAARWSAPARIVRRAKSTNTRSLGAMRWPLG